jgi:hypothetical protein
MPRQFEQVVHQSDEVFHLPFHERDLRRVGIGEGRDLQELESGHQRGQRIAELVAEGREELVLALIGDLQRFFVAGAVLEMAAIWYWRSRARRAVWTALRSVNLRSGRSSTVTLPSERIASPTSAESAPGLVRTSTGRSDHGGCVASTSCSAFVCSNETASSGTSTAAAPALQLPDEGVEGGADFELDARRREQCPECAPRPPRSAPGRALRASRRPVSLFT